MSIEETVLAGANGGLLASAVTLVGTILSTRWRIAEENVTKERAKWRNSVRDLIETAESTNNDAELRRLWVALALRMNPVEDDQRDDRELVAQVKRLPELATEKRTEAVDRIVALAAHILKHDWERAKWEADHWFWRREEPKQT